MWTIISQFPFFEARFSTGLNDWKQEENVANRHRADYLFHEVPCEAIPREAGNYYAQLKRQSERQGTPLEDNDLWIASSALVFDAILVISDSDFRRLQGLFGLQLEDWTISN